MVDSDKHETPLPGQGTGGTASPRSNTTVTAHATAGTTQERKRPTRARRWLRALGWGLLSLVVLLGLAGGGLWWWMGRDGSLAYTVEQAARWLPQGQSLQARQVSGSLRQGGRVGWLQWQGPTMKVEVKDADIGWSLPPLLSRKLELGLVHIAELQIASTPDPDSKPTEPLQELKLPLQISAPFEVDHIRWQGPPEALVDGLKGRYSYDGQQHELVVNNVQWADGVYNAELQLQGAAPMQLKAEVNGRLQAPNPLQAGPEKNESTASAGPKLENEKSAKNENAAQQAQAAQGRIAVIANARAEGNLAGENALLTVTAKATAQPVPSPAGEAEEVGDKKGLSSPDNGLKQLSNKKQMAQDTHPAQEMQLDLAASVAPWKPQPLLTAGVKLQQLDVAAFWPQGPRTLLNGELSAGPISVQQARAEIQAGPDDVATPAGDADASALKDTGWRLVAKFDNRMPGPWDKQRLPLSELQAHVLFDGQRWSVKQAKADIGKGEVELLGYYDSLSSLFEGEAKVRQLNPADLYSTLDAAPLQGSLSAKAVAAEAVVPPPPAEAGKVAVSPTAPAPTIEFAADLHAAGGSGNPRALRIQTLAAKGQWAQPVLSLSHLQLEALQAKLDGKNLSYHVDQQEGSGAVLAEVPGAKLEVAGQMSAKEGKGHADLQLASMEALAQWLRKLPVIKDPLGGAQLQGQANLGLDWTGGWARLMQRLQASRGQELPASGLQIKARLQARQLRYQAAGAGAEQALQVPQLDLSLDGSPESAKLTLQGQAQQNTQRVQLDAALAGGLAGTRGAAPLDWQASIERLQAQLQPGKDQSGKELPGPWALQVQAATTGGGPVRVEQRTSGAAVTTTTFLLSGGRLQVTPPQGKRSGSEPLAPVYLSWTDSQLARIGSGAWTIRTAGQAQSIPLSWVDALSVGAQEPPLQAMGLSGDLKFNGQWNLDTTGKQLKANAVVERESGDLRLAIDDGEGTVVTRTSGPRSEAPGEVKTRKISGSGMRARIKTARLTLDAIGEKLTARLAWDSERMGTVNAELATELTHHEGAWTVQERAPLSGKVEARMPDIGIWALFAPPGWRVKGTLQANATIGGNLQQPEWQGNLNADELSVSSLLDGVDLQQGRLRAKLQSNRVDITELHFKGGKGSSTRILGYSGNLTSAPEDGGELSGTGFAEFHGAAAGTENSGLRMSLQAKASKLQVLVRSDRQVSVSGDLNADLKDGQFALRGDLTVDRATIILPEESAPSLGSDVVVHTAASRKAEAEAAAKEKREAEKAHAQPRKLPDILVKLNLGRDFALQGFGVTTRLRGQLDVKGPTMVGGPPRITGEIRTEQGRYRAWGQLLDVETGVIRFNGPYDNPSLDILAIRPNIQARAGVQVLGTAQAPRVRLYSDPDLPDAEKLSWVVMGRDPSGGGAESALLQQAALALLAGGGGGGTGKLAGSVGLDEIGFKGGGEGSGASGAALTMGKRISSKLYLTYEQSLSGAMGTIYIFYDLSRRLTLRGQTGTTSALDLIYTIRKD